MRAKTLGNVRRLHGSGDLRECYMGKLVLNDLEKSRNPTGRYGHISVGAPCDAQTLYAKTMVCRGSR